MRLLLDTHAFLWWIDEPARLSVGAARAIADENNGIYISSVVVWEMMIKRAAGKLRIPDDLDAALAHDRFIHLPVTIDHAKAVGGLPPIHRDPFDRMLIAQAIFEGHHLVTRDPQIAGYPVPTLLA